MCLYNKIMYVYYIISKVILYLVFRVICIIKDICIGYFFYCLNKIIRISDLNNYFGMVFFFFRLIFKILFLYYVIILCLLVRILYMKL